TVTTDPPGEVGSGPEAVGHADGDSLHDISRSRNDLNHIQRGDCTKPTQLSLRRGKWRSKTVDIRTQHKLWATSDAFVYSRRASIR
ncbi:MAG: hypothetical protein KDI55_30535, partial [Anaerolineae bacterium]|nr:hypothetical protein [Anaerolineae bacterium]